MSQAPLPNIHVGKSIILTLETSDGEQLPGATAESAAGLAEMRGAAACKMTIIDVVV